MLRPFGIGLCLASAACGAGTNIDGGFNGYTPSVGSVLLLNTHDDKGNGFASVVITELDGVCDQISRAVPVWPGAVLTMQMTLFTADGKLGSPASPCTYPIGQPGMRAAAASFVRWGFGGAGDHGVAIGGQVRIDEVGGPANGLDHLAGAFKLDFQDQGTLSGHFSADRCAAAETCLSGPIASACAKN